LSDEEINNFTAYFVKSPVFLNERMINKVLFGGQDILPSLTIENSSNNSSVFANIIGDETAPGKDTHVGVEISVSSNSQPRFVLTTEIPSTISELVHRGASKQNQDSTTAKQDQDPPISKGSCGQFDPNLMPVRKIVGPLIFVEFTATERGETEHIPPPVPTVAKMPILVYSIQHPDFEMVIANIFIFSVLKCKWVI